MKVPCGGSHVSPYAGKFLARDIPRARGIRSKTLAKPVALSRIRLSLIPTVPHPPPCPVDGIERKRRPSRDIRHHRPVAGWDEI